MSQLTYLLIACLVLACCEAGGSYYYGNSGYGYNPVQSIYGYDGSRGYDDYGYYGEDDYYPYAYQKRVVVPSDYVETLPAISKSVSSSSLYQTHPSPYGYHGYAGNYEYVPKYGSVYGNTYYKKWFIYFFIIIIL